jgi:hypothetical protein
MNMWSALPLAPPYVLDEDRPHVEAWNEVQGAEDERVRLQLGVWPESLEELGASGRREDAEPPAEQLLGEDRFARAVVVGMLRHKRDR